MRGIRIRIRTTPEGMRSADSMPRTWSARMSPFRLPICPRTRREIRAPSGVSVMPRLRAMPAKMSQTVLLEKGPKAVSNGRTSRMGKRDDQQQRTVFEGDGFEGPQHNRGKRERQSQARHGADIARVQNDDQRQKDGENKPGGGFSGHNRHALKFRAKIQDGK